MKKFYYIVQLIKLPKLGKSSPYSFRVLGKMEDFKIDFETKNSIKKFMIENEIPQGKYLVIHGEEDYRYTTNHRRYIFKTDIVMTLKVKKQGTFLEFFLPGEMWDEFLNKILTEIPEVQFELDIPILEKIEVSSIM